MILKISTKLDFEPRSVFKIFSNFVVIFWTIRSSLKKTKKQSMHVTGEIQKRSLPLSTVLYQCQVPGFDNVLWLSKVPSMQEVRGRDMQEPRYYIFLEILTNLKIKC